MRKDLLKNMKHFLRVQGFRDESLNLLNHENLTKLAKEYNFLPN